MDYISREDALKGTHDIVVEQKNGYKYRHRCIDPQYIRELPAADVAEEQEITLDDVLKYCNAHRLIVISEELFYRLNHMTKIPNRTEEQ